MDCMIRRIKSLFGLDKPSKMQPFDEILFARNGETHSTGMIAEAGEYRWERAEIVSIDDFSYDSFRKKPFFLTASVETSDGVKEMMLMSCELHYLAPYVPAESVDELEGCVVPVMYSVASEEKSLDMSELLGEDYEAESEPEKCMLSAENGYLVTEVDDFATHPAEAMES